MDPISPVAKKEMRRPREKRESSPRKMLKMIERPKPSSETSFRRSFWLR
jgi:hypothetical protein